MKALFKDPSLQRQFEEKGYVVLSLLSRQETDRLLEVYHRHIRQEEIADLYESSRHNDYETNRQINQAIYEAFKPACGEIFLPSELYGGTFMVKSCRDSEMLPLHQDWSVVEEDKFSTLFIWCPLMKVSPVNGGLFVLEGSHRYFDNLRSGTYPSDRFILPPGLHAFTKDLRLKAGEAVLYSDKLFHGSHANNGDQDRIVVTARIIEPKAALVYFHQTGSSKTAVYQASPEFYLTQIDRIAKGQKPLNMPLLYTKHYRHLPVTDDALRAKIREHFPQSKNDATMNCRLFKDQALQSAFETEGYVVIDLIGPQQVAELLAFYENLNHSPMPEYGFQVSLDNEKPEFVRAVSEKLIQTVRAGVSYYFRDHRIFTASYVVKEQNDKGVVPPHQDWTFVDEQQYWSATIWCPLIDVDIHNGALGVISGSHRFYDHVRPSPSPQYAPPFKDQLFSIFPYLKIIDLKAGQALVFDNRTLHGSPPNTAGPTRVAFGIGITHKDAPIRHYYLLPAKERPLVEGYEVDPEFFHAFNNARLSALHDKGEKPRGLNSIGVFELNHKIYETSELVAKIKKAGNVVDVPLIEKMAALFDFNLDGTPKAGGQKARVSREEMGKPPFWQVYTPMNILREIRYRLTRK